MDHEVLTLQEVSALLGKSTQTLRRMIKKGELLAKRIHTPQGFQYAVYKQSLMNKGPAILHKPPSIVDKAMDTVEELQEELPPRVNGPVLIKQHERVSFLENDYFALESTPAPSVPTPAQNSDAEWQKLLDHAHREKMALIHILERLQVDWMSTQKKRPSFFEGLFHWWKR